MYAKLKKGYLSKKNLEAYKVGFINKYDFNFKRKRKSQALPIVLRCISRALSIDDFLV